MATEKPRFTLTVPEDTLKKIDDFRFDNRYNSRTEAVLEIIRRGIEAIKKEEKNGDVK